MTEGEARRQVARGASRAVGERAARRRRTTPLLAGRESVVDPPAQCDAVAVAEPAAPPEAAVDQTAAVARVEGVAHPVEESPADRASTAPGAARVRRTVRVRAGASRRTPGGDRLVAVADAAHRVGEELAEALEKGTGPAQTRPQSGAALEERLAAVLAFVRRRLTGDFAVDEFGFDPELTDTVLLNVFRPLYRKWFRVEVRGIENIPSVGGALVVANHSGAIAFDSLMTAVAVHDEHPAKRHLRMLGADLVFSTPVLGELARKGGATLASNADAERLLSGGELVAVWPEGFKGIGKPFSERYKLQRFGRGGFVSAALKTGVPIVPCAIVGAEETYPIIGNMPSVARLLGVPYAPVTPTWPLLGPLGLIPLPSKWLIEFCAPVVVDSSHAGQAAEDPMTVFDLTDQVRQTIQQTLYSLLVQRRSVFF
jgi:1-acyl-sn-glycerol-3-phosphate acyltransferase